MDEERPSSQPPTVSGETVARRAVRRPLTLGRKAAEDIPLLPSHDHLMLVSLAVLVGLLAGLAANVLRVGVRLIGALTLHPSAVLDLVTDVESAERARFLAERASRDPDLLAVGAGVAACFFAYGFYRDRSRAQDPERPHPTKHSRAYLIGLVLAGSALLHWGLRVLSTGVNAVMPARHGLLEIMMETPWWGLLAVALTGGLLLGWWSHRLLSHSSSNELAMVIASVALRGGSMPTRIGPSYAGAAGLTAAAFGSVGLEGPVVVFGASSASWLGGALALSRDRLRVLVAAGAASGIAAAFNAPIAGALFAIEVIIGEFGLTMFSPVVIASVMGTAVHRSIEGNHPLFSGVHFYIDSTWEILLYIPLGLLCGTVGTLFVRTLEGVVAPTHKALGIFPSWLRPAVGLSAVVLVASTTGMHEVLGSGYDTLTQLLDVEVVGFAVLIILVGKLLSTSLTLAAGGIGGIFLPSLFLGACTGAAYGSLGKALFGERIAPAGSFALVGMGAVLTAVQQAPLTAIVMIFELCNDYNVMLPLIVSCILSTLVAMRALGMSFYHRELRTQGIVISRGKEQNILGSLRVRDAMQRDAITVHHNTPLGKLEQIVAGCRQTTFPLVDEEDRLAGVLSLSDMRHVMFEHEDINDLVVALELGHREVHIIHPRDSLKAALEELAVQQFENLVVVDDEDDGKVVGLLSHQAVMDAYQKALRKAGVFDRSGTISELG